VKLLSELLKNINVEVTDESIEKFKIYYEELVSWNKQFNLTAITEKEKVIIKHFYDSLLAVKTKGWVGKGSMVDVGTGAGFPGVPLKIIHPEIKATLVDSVNKKIVFLKSLMEKAGIDGVEIVQGRAEEIAQREEYREKYDHAVSRAVASVPVLLEYCLPLLKTGGNLIIYKGREGESELERAKTALAELGGAVIEKYKTALPKGEGERMLITIRKERITPKKYPRRTGIPEKKPL
jgi:16S rRNA (guanine527-N7)-methyltransferase